MASVFAFSHFFLCFSVLVCVVFRTFFRIMCVRRPIYQLSCYIGLPASPKEGHIATKLLRGLCFWFFAHSFVLFCIFFRGNRVQRPIEQLSWYIELFASPKECHIATKLLYGICFWFFFLHFRLWFFVCFFKKIEPGGQYSNLVAISGSSRPRKMAI